MNLSEAISIATYYREAMEFYCDRIEIAGSIRRRVRQVKDIELVCAPKIDVEVRTGADLFGGSDRVVHNRLFGWAIRSGIYWIKPGTSQLVEWALKPNGKYWRGVVRAGSSDEIKLDIFLTTPANFGTTLLIRTGSCEFNVALMSHARRLNRECSDNRFHREGQPVEFAEERQIFEFLDLEYVRPSDRVDGRVLRRMEAA